MEVMMSSCSQIVVTAVQSKAGKSGVRKEGYCLIGMNLRHHQRANQININLSGVTRICRLTSTLAVRQKRNPLSIDIFI
jgi:hypothetical protein